MARQEEDPSRRRNIIKDFADFGSTTYAPITRFGRRLDKDSHRFTLPNTTALLHTFKGMAMLEARLKPSLTTVRINRPNRVKPRAKTTAARKLRMVEVDLEKTAAALASHRDVSATPEPRVMARSHHGHQMSQTPGGRKPHGPAGRGGLDSATSASFWRSGSARRERPQTPRVPEPPQDEEEHLAVLQLQRLIRGRAVQNLMFEGKERRKELIRELRMDKKMEKDDSWGREEEAARKVASRRRAVHKSALDTIAGEVVCALFESMVANDGSSSRERREENTTVCKSHEVPESPNHGTERRSGNQEEEEKDELVALQDRLGVDGLRGDGSVATRDRLETGEAGTTSLPIAPVDRAAPDGTHATGTDLDASGPH